MMPSQFALIDIVVSHFVGDANEVDYYILSALAHQNPVPGDLEPVEYHDDPDRFSWDTEVEAIDRAKEWGRRILADEVADQVTIFRGGSEYQVITRTERSKP